jgi:hypothetical protein
MAVIYNKIGRTVNTTIVTVLVFDDETNTTKEVSTILNNKLKADKVMSEFSKQGFKPIKVLSLSYGKEYYEMDLDTFIKYAKRIEK